MCGRYGFSVKDAREVQNRFDTINTLEDLSSRYNIAPGQMNPVITQRAEGNTISRMFWGLIPHWSKDDSFKFKTINARVEGIEAKPVYRTPFRTHRCLIPATGFYEWDKSFKPSRPYYFKLKDDSIFAFAGLFDIWHDKSSGKEIQSYTIITTVPNETVGKIHSRMPVILKRENEAEWLDPDIVEPERLHALLTSYPDDEMESFPISSAINNPRTDNQDLINPIKNSG